MRVSGQDWVLANTNVSGYFRVNYDPDNWDRLLSVLNTNHQVSHKCFPVCALCPHLDGMTTKDCTMAIQITKTGWNRCIKIKLN